MLGLLNLLLEAFEKLDGVLTNIGSLYTFKERGLTYVSAALVRRVAWKLH